MRGLAIRLFAPVVFLLACSDDGVPADGGSDTTSNGDDDDDDDTAPTMSGDDTLTATMTDPTDPSDTSAADGPESSGGTTSPTDGTTDTTGTGSSSDGSSSDGSSSDGSSSDGSSSDGSSSDDSSTDTGPDPADECVVDDDCVLIDDCCTCEAIPATDPAPDCDIKACLIPTCQSQGIPSAEAVCEFGSCEIANVECNPDFVSCDSLPPDCGAGFYPAVDVDAACWTGTCVPAEVCETVPSCDDCPADETCVEYSTQLGPQYHCSPIPDSCDGTPSCACMSDACESPFDSCGDGPSGIACSCPVCG
jgi:hypothetical protein